MGNVGNVSFACPGSAAYIYSMRLFNRKLLAPYAASQRESDLLSRRTIRQREKNYELKKGKNGLKRKKKKKKKEEESDDDGDNDDDENSGRKTRKRTRRKRSRKP